MDNNYSEKKCIICHGSFNQGFDDPPRQRICPSCDEALKDIIDSCKNIKKILSR